MYVCMYVRASVCPYMPGDPACSDGLLDGCLLLLGRAANIAIPLRAWWEGVLVDARRTVEE